MRKLLYILFAFFAFVACDKNNGGALKLDGDCDIVEMVMDEEYNAVINKTDFSVKIRVPETYDVTTMKLTKLVLSEGATADAAEGESFNMSVARVIRIKNGDVYLDWTVRAQRDAAKILSFKINGTYSGIIDEAAKTIMVNIPQNLDIKALTPTIVCSEDATVTPRDGMAMDFSNPVQFTVENNTAKAVYTVTVNQVGKPSAVYIGLASSIDGLNIEEQTACNWMLSNIENSIYASFEDIRNSNVNLDDCKVIWWHFHKDGGVDGKGAFEAAAPEALAVAGQLRDYYENGGSFFLTRYATNLPAYLGAVRNNGAPNNCWGQNEDAAEEHGNSWDFKMTGHTDHAIYQGLKAGEDANGVYLTDKGYCGTNSTAQWHIGSDWGGYDNLEKWREETGAVDLGYGGDGAVVAWEFPANAKGGKILCIGSGCYDWYSYKPFTENFHANMGVLTKNSFDYLTK